MKKRITFDIDSELHSDILELKEELPFSISTSSFINTLLKMQVNKIEMEKNNNRNVYKNYE